MATSIPGFEGLARRTINRLANAGIRSREQLEAARDERLMKIRGFGAGMLAEVVGFLGRPYDPRPVSPPPPPPSKLARPARKPHRTPQERRSRRRTRRNPRWGARARSTRTLILRQLDAPDPPARGWQTAIALRTGVSRQFVHEVLEHTIRATGRPWPEPLRAGACAHWRDAIPVAGGVVLCSGLSAAPATWAPHEGRAFYLDPGWRDALRVHVRRSRLRIIVDWPDVGLIPGTQLRALAEAAADALAGGEHIEIGCSGGHGRTGTLLAAIIAVAEFGSAAGALRAARQRYCKHAVETEAQALLVFEALGEAPQPRWHFRAPVGL